MRRGARSGIALPLVAVGALAIGACGDDDSEPAGAGPSTLAPAHSLVYAEGVVRPEGDQRDAVEGTLGSLLGEEDPGGFIVDQLERELNADGFEISYAEDLEPWLGERVAIFFLDFEDESNGAFIAEATDETGAREAIDRLVEQDGNLRQATYEGVEYSRTDAGAAAGVVDGFAVLGSNAGFQAAVDASRGDSLADSDPYAEALDQAPQDRLATVYSDFGSVLDALVAADEITEGQRALAEGLSPELLEAPLVAALGADDTSLFAEIDVPIEEGGGGGEESELLERLPDDAWLAVGIPDAGDALTVAGNEIAAASSVAAILDRLSGEAGIDLPTLGESIGAAAGYLSGESVLGVSAAVVLKTNDEAASTTALEALRSGLESDPSIVVEPGDAEGELFSVSPADVPIEFPFVVRDGLVVAGLGQPSVDQVFAPESSLTDSEAYRAATDALGDDFGLLGLLDFEPLVEFFGGIPDVTADPDLRVALPYLERLDFLALGSEEGEGRGALRLALGVDGE